MTSTKQKTIAMSALAIVVVLALFASAPLVAGRVDLVFAVLSCPVRPDMNRIDNAFLLP